MGRVVAVVLLSLSLTAFAQTTAPAPASGTVPARVNLDPATPSVGATTPMNVMTQPAAPGETSIAVPEYRVATPIVPSGPPASAVESGPSAAPISGVLAQPVVNAGAVSYGTEPAAPSASTVSVADAAAQYRANKATMKSRVIDNNSLATLDNNPSGLVSANDMTMPQSDLSPEEEAALRNAKPEHAAAGDVLDPRDLAAVEAAIRRGEMQQDAAAAPAAEPPKDDSAAQYEQFSREAESNVQLAQAQTEPQTEPQIAAPDAARTDVVQEESADSRERLPESASTLPFIALLGFLTLAGGAASLLRARA